MAEEAMFERCISLCFVVFLGELRFAWPDFGAPSSGSSFSSCEVKGTYSTEITLKTDTCIICRLKRLCNFSFCNNSLRLAFQTAGAARKPK
jgi:hypothetical protein